MPPPPGPLPAATLPGPRLLAPVAAGLAALQLAALAVQLLGGFVPGRTAPARVAFSWDMFAPPIVRCTLEFTPPLPWPGRPLHSLRQLGWALEWDMVFDTAADYAQLAAAACRYSGARARVRQRCFSDDGRVSDSARDCP